jgi:cytochrome c556
MMRTYRAWSAAAVAGLLATAMGAAAFADEPANIVKYRKAFMDANGAHITMIAAVVKGEVSFTGDIAANAQALAEQGKLLTANLNQLFPEGTAKGETAEKSAALPVIWEKWGEFEQAAQRFRRRRQVRRGGAGRRHGRDRPGARRARQAGLRRLSRDVPREAVARAPRPTGRGQTRRADCETTGGLPAVARLVLRNPPPAGRASRQERLGERLARR